MRGARQRGARGVGAGRGRPLARVLRLRGEVHRRRVEDFHPGGSAHRCHRGNPAAVDRGVPGDRLRRDGPRRLPAVAADRRDLRQRGQHHPRLHHDQHVFEAVGRDRCRLPGAPRSPDRPGQGAPRRKAAPPHQRHMNTPAWRTAAAAALFAAVLLGSPTNGQSPTAARELRGVDGLARAYDFILEARFDQVDAELRRACGPAPPEACDVLSATATWWRILVDPESRALDDEFSATAERAIRVTEAWSVRSPADAEAWFYLGAAYAARVQWRVLRDEKLAAARDGKPILQALGKADR